MTFQLACRHRHIHTITNGGLLTACSASRYVPVLILACATVGAVRAASAQVPTFTPFETFTPFRTLTPVQTFTPVGSAAPSPIATPSTPIRSASASASATATVGGRFVDNADGTITDKQTMLVWEKKVGSAGGVDATNLHDVDSSYIWSGQCSLSSDVRCQPNAAAAAACALGAQGDQAGCGTCQVGQGTCTVSPSGITTIWDWVVQLNTTNFAGHNDWRIPTPAELASIVDYAAMLPAVDAAFNGASCGAMCSDLTIAACSCMQSGGYWTAAIASDDPNNARIISFQTGFVDVADRSLPHVYVRAVRGGAPAPTPRFVDNGDGTVTDMQTKLIWEKKVGLGAGADTASLHAADNFYTWAGVCSQTAPTVLCQPNAAAAAACAQGTQGDPKGCGTCTAEQGMCNADPDGLGVLSTIWDWLVPVNAAVFAGHADWRVPTVAEMESLVDYLAPPPAIDGAFKGLNCGPLCTDVTSAACSCTQPNPYWTATSDANDPPLAWVTDFLFDRTTPVAKSGINVVYVRAVRGGLTPPPSTTPTLLPARTSTAAAPTNTAGVSTNTPTTATSASPTKTSTSMVSGRWLEQPLAVTTFTCDPTFTNAFESDLSKQTCDQTITVVSASDAMLVDCKGQHVDGTLAGDGTLHFQYPTTSGTTGDCTVRLTTSLSIPAAVSPTTANYVFAVSFSAACGLGDCTIDAQTTWTRESTPTAATNTAAAGGGTPTPGGPTKTPGVSVATNTPAPNRPTSTPTAAGPTNTVTPGGPTKTPTPTLGAPSSTPSIGMATPTPGADCGLLFTDPSDSGLCNFQGTYNSGCGVALNAVLLTDGLGQGCASDLAPPFVVVIVATEVQPQNLVYFSAHVDSATSASLCAWSTDAFQTPTRTTSGILQLNNDGTQLVVSPNSAPFLIQGCAFVQYVGTYTGGNIPTPAPTLTATATSTLTQLANTATPRTSTRTSTITRTVTLTPTPTATPRVVQIAVGSAHGAPAGEVNIVVSLTTAGLNVAATGNDIEFDGDSLALTPGDCEVNRALGEDLVITPLGQDPDTGGTGVRFFVQSSKNTAIIPDGPLYACKFHILSGTFPGDYPLYNQNALAFSPAGGAIPLVNGTDGSITVSLVPRACVGDCNGDGTVAINELILGVDIALGEADVTACPAIDANDDLTVSINELILAVDSALSGCTS